MKRIKQKGIVSYIHEFSGTKIKGRERHPIAICKTLNKNFKTIQKQGTQKKARYPAWKSYTSNQNKRGVIIGSLHRINLQNSIMKLSIQSMYKHYREY